MRKQRGKIYDVRKHNVPSSGKSLEELPGIEDVDNVDGYAKNSYEDTGTIVDGILAQATSNERELTKHLWDQKLHSLTHTLVVSGRCDLKKSDILAYEEKAYLVLAVDNAGDLGFAGIAYLEERNDLK